LQSVRDHAGSVTYVTNPNDVSVGNSSTPNNAVTKKTDDGKATVKVNGNTLTATLYDEHITNTTKFKKSSSLADNEAVCFWFVSVTDGVNSYSFFAGIDNGQFENADSLTLLDGFHYFGIFAKDDSSEWGMWHDYEAQLSVIDHRITWVVTLNEENKHQYNNTNYTVNTENISITGYKIAHDNHNIKYGTWPGYEGKDDTSFFDDFINNFNKLIENAKNIIANMIETIKKAFSTMLGG
jgi:hypothetical protein